jgi:hypothetical protein
MSNLNKELDDIFNSVDLPDDKKLRRQTAMIKRSQNESWIASRKELGKKQSEDEAFKQKAKDGAAKRCMNPDDPSIKRMKDFFNDAERRANHKAACNTKEIKELKSKNMMGKRNGYKGKLIGTNKITGEIILISSFDECKEKGFNYYAINQCINGRLKSSGGYTWTREEEKKK